jgi:hypothetical protein
MSVRLPNSEAASLSTSDGDLVLAVIYCDARLLEDLLECLAGLPFPVNPQIYHGQPTRIEFPAYANQIPHMEIALSDAGFPRTSLWVRPMLAAISAA